MDDTPTYIGTTAQKPSKKKTIWLVVMILVLIASNVAWALFFVKQQSELNTTITTLTAKNAKLAHENAHLQDTETDDATVYREIPELGVKYKKSDKTKNVTYAYSFVENTPSVLLRTTDIFKTASDNSKDASELPAPSIVKLTEEQTKTFKVLDEDFATYKKNSADSVKKIGQFYYVYIGPNGLDAGKTEEAIAAASKAELKEVFKNLQAI